MGGAYCSQNGGHYDGQQVFKPSLGAGASCTRTHLVQPGDPTEILDNGHPRGARNGDSRSTKVTVAQMSVVAHSLIWFAAGITCGLIALTSAYLTNLYDANVGASVSQTWEYPYSMPGRYTQYFVRVSRFAHIVALVAGAASVVLFILGVLDVRSAVILLGK